MALSFENLNVALSGRPVLHGIDAMLRPGKVTTILGPNGAGKSTLVRTAAALVTPQAGAVRLDDRDVAALDPRDRARAIGYLPQDAAVHWNIPVSDVVALGRVAHRSPFAGPSPADLDAVMLAMEATQVTALADRPVQELSGGERARVLLARVLAGSPRWLLADEPLASLDPAHQLDMLARLRGVAAEGAGVVIVLHDLLQAGRVADDVLLLRDGRVLAFGAATDVLTPANLADAYDIEVTVTLDAAGRPLCIPLGRAAS